MEVLHEGVGMKRIVFVICVASIPVWFGVEMYLRFANPAMTETQLFLEFWPVHLAAALFVIGMELAK